MVKGLIFLISQGERGGGGKTLTKCFSLLQLLN